MKRPKLPPLPDKHKVFTKGEHLFHGSYLAVEAMAGHGPLSWLAAGVLFCILADVAIHWLGD